MDDNNDQLTRQRAMDAAATVAVAAAAAAHQSQEAAIHLHHQQQQEESNLEEKPNHGDLNMNGDVEAHRSSPTRGEEKPVLLNEDEKTSSLADNSMQYVASDYPDQNGDLSQQIDDSQTTSIGRPTVHHTKRRRINTCLPCKRRKVKCDRVRSYCGQCKKHNFPASECTWSLAVETSPATKAAPVSSPPCDIATSTAVADAAVAAVVNSASAAASGSQWYEMNNAPWANFHLSEEQNSQSLVTRVAELEAALSATKNEHSNGLSRINQAQWDGKEIGLSEAERVLAADALAMIAQHDPQASALPTSQILETSQPLMYKAKRLFSFTTQTQVFPYYGQASTEQIKSLLSLLPELPIIEQLLADFDTMQEYGLDVGIDANMVKYQLERVWKIVEKSKGEEVKGIDLSLIALLFFITAFSLEMKSTAAVFNLELIEKQNSFESTTESQRLEAVHEVSNLWSAAGQALLDVVEYESNPNLNILCALSAKRHYLGLRGKAMAARSTLATAMSLYDAPDIANLKLHKDQEADLPNLNVSSLLPNLGESNFPQVERVKLLCVLPESVQRLYCSLVAQYCLEGDHTFSIRIDFDCPASKYAGEYGMTKALFELAAKVEEKKKESTIRCGTGQVEYDGELGEGWYYAYPILKEEGQDDVDIEEVEERYGLKLAFQCQLLKIITCHQIMKSRWTQLGEEDVESAKQILCHRRWFEEHEISTFDFNKVTALKQITLEAVLTVAIHSLQGGQMESRARADFNYNIGTLNSDKTGLNNAQKLVHLLDKKKEEDFSVLVASIAKSACLNNSHDLSAYLGKVCSLGSPSDQERRRFWHAIAIYGARLMQSSVEASI